MVMCSTIFTVQNTSTVWSGRQVLILNNSRLHRVYTLFFWSLFAISIYKICLKGGDEGDSELLVNHKSKDSHHGGTSLVQLNGALGHLGLGIEGVPAKVERVVTEVTDELSSGDVLHHEQLKESDESNNLGNAGSGDGADGGETVGDISKGGAREVNVSRETDSGLLDKVSNDGKHGDTSVLDLDVTETVELVLVSVGNHAEGIVEAKRRLGSELILEGLQGGGGLGGLLGRGKGGGSGKEGGEDGELHICFWK